MASILGDLNSQTDLEQIAGAGGINYLQIGNITKDFEGNNTMGWNRYANTTPAALPEVSPGGTPNAAFTFAANNSSPLRGQYSGLLTKDANNRQGHGVRSDAFSIHNVDVSQPLYIAFDYECSSNYVAGDLTCYISDGTNIIYPSLVNIPGGKGTMKIVFNATTSTSYRLYFHVATTSALSYTVKLDTLSVGPQQGIVTAAISDWQTYTPTFTNFTVSASAFTWRRVGDSMEIKGQATLNAAPTGVLLISIPTGYTIDSTKAFTNDEVDMFGTAILRDSGTENEAAFVIWESSTRVQFRPTEGELLLVNATIPFTWASGDRIGMHFKVPITGWSSNINLVSNSTEYAFNTSAITAAGASDTSSFGYGAEGTFINAINSTQTIPSQTSFLCRFKTPIQPTDKIELEFKNSASTRFLPVDADGFGYLILNSTFYGASLVQVNDYDVEVRFSNGGARPYNSATYGAANGDPWSGFTTWKWRVRKSSGSAVGEQPLPNSVQGYVFTGPTSMGNGTDTDVSGLSFSLAPGTYWIEYGSSFRVDQTVAPTLVRGVAQVQDGSNNDFSPAINQARATWGTVPNGISTEASGTGAATLVLGAQTTIKLRVRLETTSGTITERSASGCFLRATRLY